jgi:hypothetical protein
MLMEDLHFAVILFFGIEGEYQNNAARNSGRDWLTDSHTGQR